MRRTIIIASIVLAWSIIASTIVVEWRHSHLQRQILSINNDDVQWYGGVGGIDVYLTGESERIRSAFDPSVVPMLIAAIDDPERGVAAHVILSLCTEGEQEIDARQWNGVSVRLAHQTPPFVEFPHRDIQKRKWRRWWEKHCSQKWLTGGKG